MKSFFSEQWKSRYSKFKTKVCRYEQPFDYTIEVSELKAIKL